MSDGSSGLRVPVGIGKGHSDLVATGYIAEGEYFGLNRRSQEITISK
jgi:hypothetical protein